MLVDVIAIRELPWLGPSRVWHCNMRGRVMTPRCYKKLKDPPLSYCFTAFPSCLRVSINRTHARRLIVALGTIPGEFTIMAHLSKVCLHDNMMRCHLRECDNIAKQTVTCNAMIRAAQASKPYILTALVILVSMVAFPTLGLVLAAIHIRCCKDPACLHRHPGFIHPWLGALTGKTIFKQGCKWCR